MESIKQHERTLEKGARDSGCRSGLLSLVSAPNRSFKEEGQSPRATTMAHDPKAVVLIRYTNYRGETAVRRIVPLRIRFASSEWHPAEQWLMDAYDLDREAERSF